MQGLFLSKCCFLRNSDDTQIKRRVVCVNLIWQLHFFFCGGGGGAVNVKYTLTLDNTGRRHRFLTFCHFFVQGGKTAMDISS